MSAYGIDKTKAPSPEMLAKLAAAAKHVVRMDAERDAADRRERLMEKRAERAYRRLRKASDALRDVLLSLQEEIVPHTHGIRDYDIALAAGETVYYLEPHGARDWRLMDRVLITLDATNA